MGKRGPKAKLAAETVDASRKAERERREKSFRPGRPECPADVTDSVREQWDVWCDWLISKRRLGEEHGHALSQMIQARENWLSAERDVEVNGYTINSGEIVKTNPAVNDRVKWHNEFKRWLADFKLTWDTMAAPTEEKEGEDLLGGLNNLKVTG